MTPPTHMFAELCRLAKSLGARVRVEPFEGGLRDRAGGLCWIDARPFIVLNEGATVLEKVAVLAEAVSRLGVAPMFVPPPLRALPRTASHRRH